MKYEKKITEVAKRSKSIIFIVFILLVIGILGFFNKPHSFPNSVKEFQDNMDNFNYHVTVLGGFDRDLERNTPEYSGLLNILGEANFYNQGGKEKALYDISIYIMIFRDGRKVADITIFKNIGKPTAYIYGLFFHSPLMTSYTDKNNEIDSYYFLLNKAK